MYEFASGVAAPVAVGLMGAQDPPLSPEPIAPAPSNFEPPAVPLRSFEAILAEHAGAVVAATAAEWPELDDRFVGPASVASIDVLSAD